VHAFLGVRCEVERRMSYRLFVTTVSQLKIFDFSGEMFKGFGVLLTLR